MFTHGKKNVPILVHNLLFLLFFGCAMFGTVLIPTYYSKLGSKNPTSEANYKEVEHGLDRYISYQQHKTCQLLQLVLTSIGGFGIVLLGVLKNKNYFTE